MKPDLSMPHGQYNNSRALKVTIAHLENEKGFKTDQADVEHIERQQETVRKRLEGLESKLVWVKAHLA